MIDFVDIEAPFSYEISSESYEPFYWKDLCFTPKFKKGFLNGFESEGVRKNAVYKDGKFYDLCLYGKLKQ